MLRLGFLGFKDLKFLINFRMKDSNSFLNGPNTLKKNQIWVDSLKTLRHLFFLPSPFLCHPKRPETFTDTFNRSWMCRKVDWVKVLCFGEIVILTIEPWWTKKFYFYCFGESTSIWLVHGWISDIAVGKFEFFFP